MTATAQAAPSRAEINRLNAQKSTGPRSAAGKARVKFNALKHGMRARTVVLPHEDPAAFTARLDAWTVDLDPRDDVDRYLVTRAVEVSWKLDRARLALEARRDAACHADADRLAAWAEEVVALGRRLYSDPVGPLSLYPHAAPADDAEVRRVSDSGDPGDPDDPGRIVVRLEAMTLGCAWLLDRWEELREVLAGGLNWQPHDRLKAVRMLGRQPLEAPDDRRVRLIYLCGGAMERRDRDSEPVDPDDLRIDLGRRAMDPLGRRGFGDVANELSPDERTVFMQRINGRLAMDAMPNGAEEARATSLAMIAEEEERLGGILAGHLEREEADAAAALAFDSSALGERLRRYESENDRALLRIIAALRQRQRAAAATAALAGPASVRAANPPPEIAGGVAAGPDGATRSAVRIHPALTAPTPGPSAAAPARPAPDEAPPAEAIRCPAPTEPRRPADPEPAAVEIELAAAIDPALPESTDLPDRPVAWAGLLAGAVLALFALLFLAGLPASTRSSVGPPAASPVPPIGRVVDRVSGHGQSWSWWLRSSRTPGEAVAAVREVRAT